MSTDLDRIPGAPAPAASQATLVEQSRAAMEVITAVRAAQAVPRDPERAYALMRAACRRWETAKRAFYAYPQGGKVIQGPTVALARDLGAFWGNLDYGTVELSRDDVAKRSEIRAWAWDQETNTRVSRSVIVPHVGYVGRNGRALTEMREIDQNNNSVAGRASRETLFAILPNEMVEEAKALCQQTLDEGGGIPLPDRIEEIVGIYAKAKPPVTLQDLERHVGRPSKAWTGNDVAGLFVLFESLKQRTIAREEVFPTGITGDELRAQAAAAVPAAVDQGTGELGDGYDPDDPTTHPDFGKDGGNA